MLNINKTNDNGNGVFALEGRLDTSTSPELEEALKASFEEADALTLDLGKLEYISSAGLRVLLLTHKTMSAKGGLKVINVNDTIKEIFEITGFSDILTIE